MGHLVHVQGRGAGEVSGFIVDALTDVFDKPKKKKKRVEEERQPHHFSDDSVAKETSPVHQIHEDHHDSLLPPLGDSMRSETPDCSLNISKLLQNNSVSAVLDNTERLIDKIDANRALSSTPTRARKMKRKLANRSDLNLLNNPEVSAMCNSSFILDSSIDVSLPSNQESFPGSKSLSSTQESLPGTQESNKSSSLPPVCSQSMPVGDHTEENPSAASVSR